ncbi:hypothetical protein ABZP36_000741 [Zizania latifolia]
MDTPDRAASAAASASTRAEDSPLFSFIDSLSPIEPVKSAYSTSSIQAYQSLNITSISSIFTSPHDNAHKESKRSKRSFAEFSESEVCAGDSDKNKPSKSSNAVKFACTSTLTGETHKIASSVGPLEGPSDLSQPGQFDAGSPDHNKTLCHGVRSDLKQEKCQNLQALQTAKNTSEKRKCLFSTEVKLDGCQPEKHNDEILGCEWDGLICAPSTELIAYDEDHKGVQLAVSNAESCGFLLSKLTGESDMSDRTHPSSSTQTYYRELIMEEDQTENAELIQDGEKNISSEEIQDNLYEANGCIPIGYKVETQQQRGMRRRCLVFESAGYSNRIMQKESAMDLSVSTFKGKSPVQNLSNPGKTPSPRVLRGIGLHLNALALTPNDKVVCQDPMSSSLVPSSATQQEAHGNLLSAGENFVNPGGELLELQMDDDCSAGVFLGNDHNSSQSNSPQKKRRRTDNGDDGEACKRCSCKKSKCLKLYCECFAAGVYCCEPCSCQGCLNKPIHEEIVLSTRKQIEFRNPLAFAPKVIRMSDVGQDTGEDPNNTPASARHKRGCNCKKSSCLKKYCECYQGGVGCSSNCRCESCKNTFGKRDAAVSTETEEMKQGEDEENVGKEKENDLQKANVQSEDHPFLELVPITPPFDVSSLLLKPPNFSSAKPPRPTKPRTGNSSRSSSKAPEAVRSRKFSKVTDSGLDAEMPGILREDASPGNCAKTSSPNGKRVSPPHNALSVSPSRKGGRKLILKSIPSFPSLLGDTSSGSSMNNSESAFSTVSPLALGPS